MLPGACAYQEASSLVRARGVSNFDQLKPKIADTASGDTVIDLGAGSNSITLQHVRKADLTAGDFAFL